MNKGKYLDALISIISILLIVEMVALAVVMTKQTEATTEINSNEETMVQSNEEQVIEQVEANEVQEIDISQIDGFYIKVNYQENVVTIYIKDEEGNFTKPYKAMVCSTGIATPKSGVYTMSDRGVWGMMVGRVWAQYYSRIDGQILFHSVPYTSKSANKLEYWEYDKLGTTASAGCVRLTVEDSKWIYDNCPAGTQVEFYADSDPGPLGKPEASKISEAPDNLKGWDPTDPNPNNPWNNY
jgi:lipoprotein-anchoring transpeptidase ErfK/SrfK